MINNLEVKHATVDDFPVAVCWIKLLTWSANFDKQWMLKQELKQIRMFVFESTTFQLAKQPSSVTEWKKIYIGEALKPFHLDSSWQRRLLNTQRNSFAAVQSTKKENMRNSFQPFAPPSIKTDINNAL